MSLSCLSGNAMDVSCSQNILNYKLEKTTLDQLSAVFGIEDKVALVAGAGLAGLAAAFELKKAGFHTVVVEKREEFSRFNVINLGCEVQAFFKKFGLLEEFEERVVAHITSHKKVIIKENGVEPLGEPNNNVQSINFKGDLRGKIKNLFKKEGVYSAEIRDLQAFLKEKAEERGIVVLGGTKVEAEESYDNAISYALTVKEEGISKKFHIEPEFLLIAEGAHGDLIKSLSMEDERDKINNCCSEEKWVFGNFFYPGERTFVTSMVFTKDKVLKIANVIFNGHKKVANVAVTCGENPEDKEIEDALYGVAKIAFSYDKIAEDPQLRERVEKCVEVENVIAQRCFKGNVLRIGDAVGHSSPLAGLGGTLALSLVPDTVAQFLEEYGNPNAYTNFQTNSQAYAERWVLKSKDIKEKITKIFNEKRGFV